MALILKESFSTAKGKWKTKVKKLMCLYVLNGDSTHSKIMNNTWIMQDGQK